MHVNASWQHLVAEVQNTGIHQPVVICWYRQQDYAFDALKQAGHFVIIVDHDPVCKGSPLLASYREGAYALQLLFQLLHILASHVSTCNRVGPPTASHLFAIPV